MDGKWIPVILTERWKLSSPVSQPSPQISQLTLTKKTLVPGNKLKRHLPSSPFFSSCEVDPSKFVRGLYPISAGSERIRALQAVSQAGPRNRVLLPPGLAPASVSGDAGLVTGVWFTVQITKRLTAVFIPRQIDH